MRGGRLIEQLSSRLARRPGMRRAAIALYGLGPARAPEWTRKHPFDQAHGVDTSGFLPGFLIAPGAETAYAAVQPSIVRTALAAIPNPQRCHFLDVGCGKGRALLVASEFPFPRITGLELSPTLARIARRNLETYGRKHPSLAPMEVVTGDALRAPLPSTDLAIFLYNPFDRELTWDFVRKIEASLKAQPRDLYVVYCNPTWARVFDASDALERRYAAQLPYDTSEMGYGPDSSDGVVIWQNRGNSNPPLADASSPVFVVKRGVLARVEAG